MNVLESRVGGRALFYATYVTCCAGQCDTRQRENSYVASKHARRTSASLSVPMATSGERIHQQRCIPRETKNRDIPSTSRLESSLKFRGNGGFFSLGRSRGGESTRMGKGRDSSWSSMLFGFLLWPFSLRSQNWPVRSLPRLSESRPVSSKSTQSRPMGAGLPCTHLRSGKEKETDRETISVDPRHRRERKKKESDIRTRW